MVFIKQNTRKCLFCNNNSSSNYIIIIMSYRINYNLKRVGKGQHNIFVTSVKYLRGNHSSWSPRFRIWPHSLQSQPKSNTRLTSSNVAFLPQDRLRHRDINYFWDLIFNNVGPICAEALNDNPPPFFFAQRIIWYLTRAVVI